MDQNIVSQDEVEQAAIRGAEEKARDREALRRRVRESLLRCPEPDTSRAA